MLRDRLGDSGSNPQVVEAATRMMTDPTIIEAMQRPEVREAMMKIQDGFKVINEQAPGLARAMGVPDMANLPGMGGMGAMGGLGAMAGASAARAPAAAQPARQPDNIRFKDAIDQLKAMGFDNEEKNIRALRATNGDVQRAVNWLVENL